MTAMLDQAAADPQQIIADLQRKLDARTAELEEKNERYALVSQAVAEGIYDWDIARNALWVSPRLIEIFGWGEPGPDAGARPSQDWNARVHPDDFEHYRAALRAALKGETARLHCEYRIRLSSGEYRWVEDHALPVRDERGWAVRLVGAVSDVTDRKRHEQALREALEQQTATAEVLQVINSSPADLTPVFEAILDKAHILCGATLGTLFLYDGEKNRAAATHGYPEEVAAVLRGGIRPPPPLLDGARLVHRHDIREDGADEVGRLISQRGGVRTNLLIPLRKDGAFLGMISCNRKEVRPYTDKEIGLIENFAAQAVIAIENARLLKELQQRTDELAARNSEFGERIEHQSATIDVLKAMSASPGDPQPVFDLIARRARDLCNARGASLHEFDGELIHLRSLAGGEAFGAPDAVEAYRRLFPMVPTRGSITCRAILDRQTIHVRDMASAPGVSAAVRNLGAKSQISLPLLRDGAAIGAVAMSSGEIGGFTDSQVELLQTFAEQAVIAITSAETYRELQQRTGDLQESLEYQTATSDVLKVISRSTFDLQPVLDTMVTTAARLCNAEMGMIARREGEAYRAASTFAFSPDWNAAVWQIAFEPGRGSVIGRVAQSCETIHIADLAADPEYAMPGVITIGKMRTALGVPLLREGEPIGVLYMARQRVEPFAERQIDLLRTFADQAVIAIENARLITETREALDQQTATAQVLEVINRSPGNLAPVFEAMVERAVQLCEADEAAVRSFDGKLLHLVAAHGEPDALEKLRELGPSDLSRPGRPVGLYDPFTRGERVVHIADVRETEAFRKSPIARKRLEVRNIRTWLAVALRREGTLLGVINVHRHEVRPFSEKQIALLENFAAQAVIAMENARLLGELRERTDELAARNSEFGERIEHQSATIDVLKAMSASPGDPQPVFDLIARRARELCNTPRASLFEFDGELVHLRSRAGTDDDPDALEAYKRLFPMVPTRGSISCRAILDRQIIHVRDLAGEPGVLAAVRNLAHKSQISVPLMRDGAAIGAVAMPSAEIGGFTDSQVALLQTFAEQAVIAITSAETYRALQQRTGDLQESLEYQTATSDVLKVISRSTSDVQPVMDTLVETAVRLCGADGGNIAIREGEVYRYVSSSYSAAEPEFWAKLRQRTIVPGRGSMAARVALEGRVVHVEDIGADPDYATPEAVATGRRTNLGVPLLREGAVLGTINLSRKRVELFTERQIELVRTFADQAVIAMENARLLSELQARTRDLEESLEYQTATSDVLNVISRSTADVQPVLDTVVETAARLCGSEIAAIAIREGEVYRYVSMSTSAAEPEYWAILRQRRIVPGRASVTARVALEARVVHVADIRADPDYASPEALASGRRTQLGVPLLRDSEPIGIIMLSRKRVEPFSERQIELVRTFADQAVIAIENARLLSELQARTDDLQESLEYQTATSDVLKVISGSSFDVQPVFDTIAATAQRLCGSDAAAITMREGEVYRYVSRYPVDEEYWETLRQRTIVPGRDSVAGRVALEGRVVHVADITADPDYAFPAVVAAGIRTNLGVPLLREGAVVGTITMPRSRVEPFTERQIELVRTFAAQAVIAIENARLLGELQQRTEELTRSVGELQALEEVARAVNSSLDLDTVLATVIGRAVLLSQADEGMIYEFDEAEEVFVPKSAFGMSAERVEALRERRIKLGETHLGRAAVERAPVYVADVQQDPSVPHAARTLPGIHAVLAVPLLREDKVVGGLVIRRRSEAGFAPTIATLMQTFAAQSVLAIENARLFQELAARGEEARRAHAAAEAALADLRRAQDRLIQAEKMASLGQLTAGIAHEIKNPLNFVNNFAGLSVELLDELKEATAPALAALDGDNLAEVDEIVAMLTGNLEKIAEHGRRADGIVKSMLEHSRGESGERRAVDLNNLVEEALNLANHGARAQDQSFNITLERDFAAAVVPIELVPQDVTRVLLNLIGNGFYAATKRLKDSAEPGFRPTLKVTTHDLGEAVEIRVRDNGAGIMPEIRDKLFQPFFTTKPTGEGTGLGLSISYDIVTQQHGGTIAVDSRVGEFTEFAVRLPRAARERSEVKEKALLSSSWPD